jgi:hypothetical protein
VAICAVCFVQQKFHESAEIARVFRQVTHSRSTLHLDEIDVQDCPKDFRLAYANFVLEEKAPGMTLRKKYLALSKLEDARPHDVIFMRRIP